MWSSWTVTWSLIFDQQLFSPRSYLTVGYNIFPHYLLTLTIFRKKKFCHKICVLSFSKNISLKIFIIRKERELIKKISASLHVKEQFFCQIYAKFEFSWPMLEKYLSTKFHEIPSIRTDGQTDITELIVAFGKVTHLIRSRFFVHFSQSQKMSITQSGNFVEPRQLSVALNQTDSKQRNKIIIICFESLLIER
jgi:hypothetical protein